MPGEGRIYAQILKSQGFVNLIGAEEVGILGPEDNEIVWVIDITDLPNRDEIQPYVTSYDGTSFGIYEPPQPEPGEVPEPDPNYVPPVTLEQVNATVQQLVETVDTMLGIQPVEAEEPVEEEPPVEGDDNE